MRKLLTIAMASAAVAPGASQAYEIVGKQLEIYGKIHVSVDQVDNDDKSNLNLASNSSRLGFKGETKINDDLNAIYQIESKINFDETGDNWAGRDTFVGLKGMWGNVKFGNMDTPLKRVWNEFDPLADRVGDARSLLGVVISCDPLGQLSGAACGPAQLNEIGNLRAKNSIQYETPVYQGLQFRLMYSTAYSSDTVYGQDNNDVSLYSTSLTYKLGSVWLGASYEDSSRDKTENDAGVTTLPEIDRKGYRLAAKYDAGMFKFGALYEHMQFGDLKRPAYGANATFNLDDNNAFVLQYIYTDKVEDGDDIEDSDARETSLSFDHKLAKTTTLYVMYTLLNNSDGANYQIKGGHDSDIYRVKNAGDDISAFSLGIIHSF